MKKRLREEPFFLVAHLDCTNTSIAPPRPEGAEETIAAGITKTPEGVASGVLHFGLFKRQGMMVSLIAPR